MSLGKHYGDPCDNESCSEYKNGKCQKYSELYDPNLSKEEKLEILAPVLLEMMTMHSAITKELKTLFTIGQTIDSDDINDMLSEIENNLTEDPIEDQTKK